MRNTNFLFLLLATLFIFTGCSSDDDSTSTEESTILGVWHSESSADPEMTLEFIENHRTHFTYHEFGNNGQDVTESGDWELNEDNLKIFWDESDEGNEIYNVEILELTDSTLKWKVNIDGSNYIEVYVR